MADFILGAIPENDTGQDQATDQAAVLSAASSRAASDPPTSVYGSKTRSQALELQKTQPWALCFPTDDDNIIFNGKEWGVKPIMFGDIYALRNNSTSDEIKTFLGISPTNTWEVLRRKIANGYPVCSEDESGYTIKLIVNATPNSLSIYYFEDGDTNLDLVGISYNSSSGNFRATISAILLNGAITQSDVVNDLNSTSSFYPLSANQGKVLNDTKAGVIHTSGLSPYLYDKIGNLDIDVSRFFPEGGFDNIEKMVIKDRRVSVYDFSNNYYLYTGGTIQYDDAYHTFVIFFDDVYMGDLPTKRIYFFKRGSGNEIICTKSISSIYQ